MAWQYQFPSTKALETVTNTTFDVKFARKILTEDDFQISPQPGSKTKFNALELQKLKAEFWATHLQNLIRASLRSIVEDDFGGDRHWVANTLSNITKKSVSNRTVQAWLIEQGKPSSRTCPEWALQALKSFVSDPINEEHLKRGRKAIASDHSSNRARSAEVDNKHSVDFATNEILEDERNLRKWQTANFETLPIMISRFEIDARKYIDHLHDKLLAIQTALQKAESFEEFKNQALELVRDGETAKWLVSDARRAIEAGTGEFASDIGIPGS